MFKTSTFFSYFTVPSLNLLLSKWSRKRNRRFQVKWASFCAAAVNHNLEREEPVDPNNVAWESIKQKLFYEVCLLGSGVGWARTAGECTLEMRPAFLESLHLLSNAFNPSSHFHNPVAAAAPGDEQNAAHRNDPGCHISRLRQVFVGLTPEPFWTQSVLYSIFCIAYEQSNLIKCMHKVWE